jgi:TP901 family phage tail tape measure protein
VALSRDVVIRLIGDADSAVKAQKAAADAAGVAVTAYRRAEREFDRQQKAMEAASRKQRDAMDKVGQGALALGAGVVAGLGMAVKAAMDWESAWAGVTKTVNGTDAQLATIEEGLRGLARVLPATHTEIAAVAEAAGQLGVETDSIIEFTRVMIDLGETTNLTSDEAATSLAQLMNVMGTAPEDVDRLGASLVALGNAGASTEADILKMASYLSGAAGLIGASESDVLALSNALTSMGVNAERGGGVMTRVMQDVYTAVQNGGRELEGFADVAGMSAAEFARVFEEDPIRAIGAFTDGLGRAKQNGDNVVGMLNDLGYKGTQDTAVLLQLANAQGMINENLELGNESWAENSALVEEAAKRYDTTAAKMEIARNSINEAGIQIGEILLPVLADVATSIADVAQWFADLPEPIQAVLAVLGSVAGVASLAGGAFLLLFPRVMDTVQAFKALRSSSAGAAAGMGALGKAAGVAAAIGMLGAATRALDESMAPTPATMEEMTHALLEMDGSTESLDARFRGLGEGLHGAFTEIDTFGSALQRVTDPSNTERLNDFGGALWNVLTVGISGSGEGAASRRRVLDEIKGMDEALSMWVSSGHTELAAEQFALLTEEAERNGVSLNELKELFPEYQSALEGVKNEQEAATESSRLQGEAAATLAANLDATYGSLEGYAAALGLDEEATKDLIDKSRELGETMVGFVDPLGTYMGFLEEKIAAEQEAAGATDETSAAGQEAWRRFVDGANIAFDEYLAALEKQVEDQANWQTNMLRLAGRVSAGTLEELARMGPEGAPLVADLVNRSDAELQRFDDVTAARSAEATAAWGEQLTLAAPVLAAVAAKAGQGVVDELAAKLRAGTITVAEIARQYGVNLAGGINPILTSLGRAKIQFTTRAGFNSGGGFWSGGYTGAGGKFEPKGFVHGGEFVVPMERVDALGGPNAVGSLVGMPGYAGGGYVGPEAVPRPPSTAPYRPPISTAGDASMARVYGDTVDWVRANAVPALGSGVGVAKMMAALHTVFPGLALISGFRRGSITATGNLSYHASGRAVDIPPRKDVFDWIYKNYFGATRELIFSPAGGRQIWNGRHHWYSEPTRGDHWDHVHWAMANGGIIREPVAGVGLRSGASYSFGERGPETVLPGMPVGSGAGRGGGFGNVIVEARVFVGNREITDIARVQATAVLAGQTRASDIRQRSHQR